MGYFVPMQLKKLEMRVGVRVSESPGSPGTE